ncbi:glutamate--tRNA ligase [Nitrospina sp. 32_T5]|uniref:glutamate--tRNA ligase n=1 Tax=unclassified Nitrospina TaxID=2638683 RepID=UPI003F9A641B
MTENQQVRVRFAPSPTGTLHIGGVRTALFNWLYARHHGGTFILRIEDTDLSRSTDESIQEILSAMQWLGLDYDEGPFRQMERQDRYREQLAHLLDAGKAYRCYCTAEELEAKRKAQQAAGENPRYDGTCRNRTDQPTDQPHVLRFKAPKEGTVTVKDILRGKVNFELKEMDDIILQRTDGTPTYNFVVVVDDADMRITHVIRGDDHLSNTPKQVLLYDALGAARPEFAHISMILGPDKTRLSKRHGATSTLEYKKQGYLPHALINYLARLGWSHGDQELFTLEEMTQHFALENVTISAAVFNPEKLLWVNEQWIQTSPPEELAKHLEPVLVQEGLLAEGHGRSQDEIARIVPPLQKRAKTLVEMAHGAAFYFKDEVEFDEKAKEKFLTPEVKPWFEKLCAGLEKMDEPLEHDAVEALFKQVIEEEGIKLKNLAQPVRVALTGQTASPGIYDLFLMLGKDRSLTRLRNGVN